MSSTVHSVHLGGSLPGAVSPSNLGTRRPLATATEVATVGGVGVNKEGESEPRRRLETSGPRGLLLMGFDRNGGCC